MYEWGRKMRKRALFAVPASAFLLGIAEIPPAQSFNDDHLLNVAQSGVGKLAAQTKYAVDGVVIGSQVDSATYLGYKCNPSDQFEGFTWCQKTRNDQDRRRGSTATYSILHDKDGNVVYVNRFQAPAFLNSNEADKEIQGYSHKLGEMAHVIKIPHRAGLPDGIIALWGKTTLEPLDQESIKILAGGRSPKKGLLIDFISNFARSAKDGLPIYRIGGGPGLLWVASFDQKNRGTVRFAAVDASGLSPLIPSQAPEVSVPKPKKKASATNLAGLEQTTQNGSSPTSEGKITHLENISDAAAATSQLEADNAALNTISRRWEVPLYGTIFCLTLVAWAQLRRSMKRTKGMNQPSKEAILPAQVQMLAPKRPERIREYCGPQMTQERYIASGQDISVAEALEVQQPFSLSELSLAVHGEIRQPP